MPECKASLRTEDRIHVLQGILAPESFEKLLVFLTRDLGQVPGQRVCGTEVCRPCTCVGRHTRAGS